MTIVSKRIVLGRSKKMLLKCRRHPRTVHFCVWASWNVMNCVGVSMESVTELYLISLFFIGVLSSPAVLLYSSQPRSCILGYVCDHWDPLERRFLERSTKMLLMCRLHLRTVHLNESMQLNILDEWKFCYWSHFQVCYYLIFIHVCNIISKIYM